MKNSIVITLCVIVGTMLILTVEVYRAYGPDPDEKYKLSIESKAQLSMNYEYSKKMAEIMKQMEANSEALKRSEQMRNRRSWMVTRNTNSETKHGKISP